MLNHPQTLSLDVYDIFVERAKKYFVRYAQISQTADRTIVRFMDSSDHHSKTEVPPEKWAYHPQRLPPVQQFWSNRLVQARGNERKQVGIVEMMSFAGY